MSRRVMAATKLRCTRVPCRKMSPLPDGVDCEGGTQINRYLRPFVGALCEGPVKLTTDGVTFAPAPPCAPGPTRPHQRHVGSATFHPRPSQVPNCRVTARKPFGQGFIHNGCRGVAPGRQANAAGRCPVRKGWLARRAGRSQYRAAVGGRRSHAPAGSPGDGRQATGTAGPPGGPAR